MKNEEIKDYTLKISKANKSELIVILYEIALNYMHCAIDEIDAGNEKEFKQSLRKACDCIQELINSLNFDYEMAFQLMSLYLYSNRCLLKARIRKSPIEVEHAIKVMEKLHFAFAEVSRQDSSEPVMKNTHSVFAGLTYGKENLTETCDYQGSSRGFCV